MYTVHSTYASRGVYASTIFSFFCSQPNWRLPFLDLKQRTANCVNWKFPCWFMKLQSEVSTMHIALFPNLDYKNFILEAILLNNLGYHFRWLWWPATTFVRTSGACRVPVASPWLVNDIKIWKEVKKMGVSITMMETIYHYDGNSVENGFLSQWLK